jgi:hypothetical protein
LSKSETRRLTECVSVRFTPADLRELERAAEHLGLNVPQLLRETGLRSIRRISTPTAAAPSTDTPAGKAALVAHLQHHLLRAKALLRVSEARNIELATMIRGAAAGPCHTPTTRPTMPNTIRPPLSRARRTAARTRRGNRWAQVAV